MTAGSTDDFFDLNIDNKNLSDMSGYLHFYCPDHPLSRQNGMVALHRHLMSIHLGRWLGYDDMIVFLNGNTHDVRLENLQLLNRRGLAAYSWGEMSERLEKSCVRCGATFEVVPSQASQMFCSATCAARARRLFEVSADELKQLVWQMPTTHVAELFGVSDVAIAKRCKRLGVDKPPRGYWRRVYTGKEPDPKLDGPPHLASKE